MSVRDEWIHRMSKIPAEVRTSVAIDQIVRLAEEREVLLAALLGVLRVADRATDEFDAARAAIAKAQGT
jgi:hypothetical protein